MPPQSGQKFIAANRAPRVHIEYDLESGDAIRKIEIPFVMGVLSDLAGKSSEELGAVDDRQFMEIDIDNFNDRLKAMRPRAVFDVDSDLVGEGEKLNVDITFESMDDFSPDAVARKVKGLDKLFEIRNQLRDLVTSMDGKAAAEKLITEMLQDDALLKAVAAKAAESESSDEANEPSEE